LFDIVAAKEAVAARRAHSRELAAVVENADHLDREAQDCGSVANGQEFAVLHRSQGH
jgi:hypothetical protein